MNIYVGNLARTVTDDDLYMVFKAFGQVASATIVRDKFTHEPRGFGFVEMPGKTEAQAAITALNGSDLQGQPLKVNEARPKEERPRQFRSGGGGGNRGGGGGNSGSGGGGRRW